ncbi:MAG: glycosyltransferase [Deltaproteobacteria bacterium]|nr:glycosyltransferase [Deltaproteobacteria bacterium]
MIPATETLSDRATACSLPEDHEALSDAFGRLGTAPERLRAAVLVGWRSESFLSALCASAPAIEHILLLEPDATRRRELQSLAARLPAALFVPECAAPTEIYSVAAYLAIARFLIGVRVAPKDVLFVVDQATVADQGEIYQPLALAVSDLQWCHSDAFIRLIHGASLLSSGLVMRWAEFLADHGEPFQALRIWSLLSEDEKRSSAIASRALACWDTVGCPRLMRRWIPLLPENDAGQATLSADVERAISDERAREHQTFNQNMRSIAKYRPALFDQLKNCAADAAARAERIHVALLADVPWLAAPGQSSVRRGDYTMLFHIDDDGSIELINPLREQWKTHLEVKAIAGTAQQSVAVGSIACLADVFNLAGTLSRTNLPNCMSSAYLFERDPALLFAVLRVFDLDWVWSDQRISLFVGDEGARQLVETFAENPLLPLPSLVRGLDPQLLAELRDVAKRRQQQSDAAFEQLARKYDDCRRKELREVLAGARKRPLRVLLPTCLFTTVLQYVTRDIAAAFAELGHEVRVVQERTPHERVPRGYLAGEIVDFDPDLIFMIDVLRPHFGGEVPPGIPVVCWIQDDLPRLSETSTIENLSELDFTYTINSDAVARYRALGYPHLELLPFAANTEIYRPAERPIEARDEVAYITNLVIPKEPAAIAGLFAELEPLFEAMDEVPLVPERVAPVVEAACKRLRRQVTAAQLAAVLPAATMLARKVDRVRYADWLLDAEIPLALYGRGWSQLPRFRAYSRGIVESGAALCEAYQRSKVVLHINRGLNCHMRVFEGLSSGGFVLARADASDLLPGEFGDRMAIGSEIEVFTSRDDLVRLVRRAFSDERWRRGVIEAGRQRVLRDHRYRSRVQSVIGDLCAALGS